MHGFVPGGEDAEQRTVCAICGQLWEDKGHDHEPPVSSVRMSAEQLWVLEVRMEIDDYMVMLRKLRSLPPDEVFLELSGITARLAELRLTCVRSESRRLTGLRTREIDPLIEECDRQFRFHSRIQAVRTMEADMTRGMT